jgi:hypothetical protein
MSDILENMKVIIGIVGGAFIIIVGIFLLWWLHIHLHIPRGSCQVFGNRLLLSKVG